jgi:hypothetical protein
MTNWQYEYRAFMDADPTKVREAVEESMKDEGLTKRVQKETDTYCVGGATNIAVRVRKDEVKMKGPVKAVDDLVDEMYDGRATLPVDRKVIADALGLKADKHQKVLNNLDEVKEYMQKKGSKTSTVEKDMTKYEGANVEIEVSKVKIDGTEKYTICVAGWDPKKVREAVEKYGIKGLGQKMCYAEAVKQFGQ